MRRLLVAVASTGVRHVLVNGVPVVRDGRVVEGVAPGRAVRAAREGSPGAPSQ